MSHAPDLHLLEALVDSWDRNNTILVNLLPGSSVSRYGVSASYSFFTSTFELRPLCS